MIPVYNDVGKCSIYQMFSSLSRVKLIFGMSPYLDILCISSEKRYYTENTYQFQQWKLLSFFYI